MDVTRLDRITQSMQRHVDSGAVAGLQGLVFYQDKEVYFDQVGYQDVVTQAAIDENTLFRIYSMTKAITSVALMSLLERGLCHLDDPASKWIPKMADLEVHGKDGKLVPLDRPVSLRHLLTHTAGFSYGFDPDSHPLEKQYGELWRPDRHQKTVAEMVDVVMGIPLFFQPGTHWNYSVATDICGHIVELISGQSLDEFMLAHIFKPLNMGDTSFTIAQSETNRFATLYGESDDNPLAQMEPADMSPFVRYPNQPSTKLMSGGGGLVSTARDYLQFARMLLNGGELNGQRILGRKTVEWMTKNHLDPSLLPLRDNGIVPHANASYGFGLGFCVNMDETKAGTLGSTGDYGWGGMAGTYCWIDPKEQLIGIVMQQLVPKTHHTVREDFRNSVYQALV